jgi:GGDEF domain-containing protein
MFQSGKSSSAPRNIRLPKQSAMPSYGDVQFLMQEANKIIGRWVELPFAGKDKRQEFILAVQATRGQDDPNWTLYLVTGTGQVAQWQYPSRDVGLICNLILTASGADQVEEMVSTSALMGDSVKATSEMSSINLKAVTTGGSIQFEPPRPGARSTLEGDLKNLQVPNLLQSINLAKMTGKLDIRNKSESAELFFHDGLPMHAAVQGTTGDSAVIELITWQLGEFRFWPDEKTSERTVTKRLDSMLMEGVALLDQNKYLTETAGLKLESCLVKKNAMISEEEFMARVAKGAPIGLGAQLDFYELIDNRNTLFDLLRNRPMTKVEWVPILFNLVSCGLVSITDQAPQQNRLASLKALGIDDAAVQGVIKNLIRPETGIFTYPAFIYLLDQEYLRYEYFNTPFSLLVFSIGQRKGDKVESLQMLAVRRAMQRISVVKRAVDMLGHYETFDYAMLLPNTNSAAASALATRIADVLREAPLSSDMDLRSLALAFGVATVPEDCQELDKVLLAARKARDKAKYGTQRVVLARDIINQPGGLNS